MRKEKVEDDFRALLDTVAPTEPAFIFSKEVFQEAWQDQTGATINEREAVAQEIVKTERGIRQLLDRIVEATNPDLVSAHEKKLGEMQGRKSKLTEKLSTLGKSQPNFDQCFRTALEFL